MFKSYKAGGEQQEKNHLKKHVNTLQLRVFAVYFQNLPRAGFTWNGDA